VKEEEYHPSVGSGEAIDDLSQKGERHAHLEACKEMHKTLTEEKEKKKAQRRTQIDEAKVDDAIVDLNVEDVAAEEVVSIGAFKWED
jgi:hypothetical protein